jgi:hypothetical protein
MACFSLGRCQATTSERLLACAVCLGALALYGATLAPTVTLVDSGELIVAARSLGVAHPPGFPLYLLLVHAATLVPFGSVALRANFASALFGALAAAALTLVAAEALVLPAPVAPRRPAEGRHRRHRGAPLTPAHSQLSGARMVVPPLVAGLLIASSRTLWSYATVTEVYTLNTLLILVVFYLVMRWRRSVLEHNPRDTWLYAAAFTLGLALGVHHVTVGLTLPGLAVLVYSAMGRRFFASRRLLWALLWGCGGLAIYLYLPLAAARAPILNWGDPRTLQRIWWHVGGRQYLVSLAFSAQGMLTQARDFVRLAAREFGPWWLPSGLALSTIGCVAVHRRDRALFWCLALIVLCDLGYALNYDIAEDKDAYYLPTFIAAALAAAFGARWLLDRAAGIGSRSQRRTAVTAAGLLLVPAVSLASNLPFNNRHHDYIAQDYVQNILSTIAPGGLVLTLDWQVYSPLLYARTIDQRRRDVTVIDVNLLRRSWYFDYLRREYPELLQQTSTSVAPFLDDLRHWEQNPAAYERDRTLTRRIDTRFNDLILAIVSHHIQSAPVYVTQDVVLNPETRAGPLAKALTATYQLVPQGLVFQLFADRAFHEPDEPRLLTRGLTDGTLRFDSDDVVTLKVRPVYASMLYNRGRYLALHGRREPALAAFEQALALDPQFAPARRALAGGG